MSGRLRDLWVTGFWIACASLSLVVPARAATAPTPAGTLVRLNDFGSDDIAYFSIPSQAPLGGIVLVHDAWGLNVVVSLVADHLAAAGYIVVAPDLFNGQTTTDPVRAADYRRDLSPPSAEQTITSSVRFLRESPRFRATHISIVGWGMGSDLALEAAAANPAIEGIVLIGGPLPFAPKTLAKINAPVLAIFDSADPNLAPNDRQQLVEYMGKEKKDIEVHDLRAGALLDPSSLPAPAWPWLLDFFKRAAATPRPTAVQELLDKMNPFHPDGAERTEDAKPADSNQ